MSKSSLLLFALYMLSTSLWAQQNFQAKYESAESYISSGFFDLARNLLSNVQSQTEVGSDDYRYCVDKIAHTYSLQWDEGRNAHSSTKRLSYLNSFLTHIEKEGKYLGKSLQHDRKYYIYEALIGEYLHNRNADQALHFQHKLYEAHQGDSLPSQLNDYFSLGKFSNGNISVWGYEWYEGLAAEEDHGSSSKIIFSVYPANSPGEEETELLQFHLKKISWIDSKLGEYILVKRPGAAQEGSVTTLWDFSFDTPLNYLELIEIVMSLAMPQNGRG